VKWRPLSGISRTVCAVTACPTSDETRSTSGTTAWTITLSFASPTVRWKSCTSVRPTSNRRRSTTTDLNPGADAVAAYDPTGSAAK
jgi:hypothetical protein